MTCDFQQCGILTSVDSDEPVQSPFKLRNSKWCSVSCLTLIEYSSDLQRLWSDCAYAQADLRLCWLHIPHCWKSHALALLLYPSKISAFFVCVDALCPSQQLFSHVWTNTKKRINFISNGHNTVAPVSLKPAPLDLKFSTLPLNHCANSIRR